MNSAVTIKTFEPAKNEDQFNALKEAYLGLFKDPANLKFLSSTGIPFEEELVSNWLKTATAETGGVYQVALDSNDKIIGITVLKFNPIKKFELWSLVVDKTVRRSGVGRKLVESAINYGKDMGFKAIDIEAFADNKSMLLLLIKMDFIPVRMTYHARCDGTDIVQFKKYI